MIKWKVSIEGLPTFFMDGSSASSIKMQLRKILRSPEMLQSVTRITEIDFKKLLRARLSGKDIKQDEDDDVKQEVEEDAPASSAGHGHVAGIGVDHPDGEPVNWGEPGVYRDMKKKNGKPKVTLIDRRHDRRTKDFRNHTNKLLVNREKYKQKKLQASYGEQTESTRPQSKFIHDILYK